MNATRKINDVSICGDKLNDLTTSSILYVDDIILCPKYYQVQLCCDNSITNYAVGWSETYTPSTLVKGDVFSDVYGNCWKVYDYLSGSTGYETIVLPPPGDLQTYSNCTECTNVNGCFYKIVQCCDSTSQLVVSGSSAYSGSGGTVSLTVRGTPKGNVDTCVTITEVRVNVEDPTYMYTISAGTTYATCADCTDDYTLCIWEVMDCCTQTVAGVFSGQVSGNTVFVDTNGDCWEKIGQFPDTGATITLTMTNDYDSCDTCLHDNGGCNWAAERCCYETIRCEISDLVIVNAPFSSYSGGVWRDDTNNTCYRLVEYTGGTTFDFKGDSFYSDCCQCLNQGNTDCGGNLLVACCNDPGQTKVIAGEVDLAIGDVIVIGGICYEIIECGDFAIDSVRECGFVYGICDDCTPNWSSC
jgi:hypothetical protein